MNMRRKEQTKDTSSKIALITEICCSVLSKNYTKHNGTQINSICINSTTNVLVCPFRVKVNAYESRSREYFCV